ncbi:MAG: hypothetical protein U5N86_10865 [Planctomycetota bacterium]|nr:hypothetical protein [Planctomycetota bacterium]
MYCLLAAETREGSVMAAIEAKLRALVVDDQAEVRELVTKCCFGSVTTFLNYPTETTA